MVIGCMQLVKIIGKSEKEEKKNEDVEVGKCVGNDGYDHSN